MLPESAAIIEKHLHHWELYKRTGELVNFHPHIRAELIEVWRKEHDPYFHLNQRCPVCVVEFVNKIFKWYELSRQ